MSSVTDDIADILLGVPWWVNVVLAALAYTTLRYLAPALESQNPIVIALAMISPTLAPVVGAVFVLAAGFTWALAAKRRSIFRSRRSIDSIRMLTWKEFEAYVHAGFEQKGYAIQQTPPGPDGGIDLIIRRDGQTYLVQCKHWKSMKVGVKEARELVGIVTVQRAAGGILVTTGNFTSEAREYAKQAPLELLDGDSLLTRFGIAATIGEVDASSTPVCPKCGSTMLRRVARRGKYEGQAFWGCTGYPTCNGKQAI